MIIATFTKLFDKTMVASNRSELVNNAFTRLSAGWFSSSTSFKSEGESEKKAISEAETNPEIQSSNKDNTNATTAPTEGVATTMPWPKEATQDKYESGSNE